MSYRPDIYQRRNIMNATESDDDNGNDEDRNATQSIPLAIRYRRILC